MFGIKKMGIGPFNVQSLHSVPACLTLQKSYTSLQERAHVFFVYLSTSGQYFAAQYWPNCLYNPDRTGLLRLMKWVLKLMLVIPLLSVWKVSNTRPFNTECYCYNIITHCMQFLSLSLSRYIYTVKPALTGPPIYRKPGQTENKFWNGIISCVK
jgi:hypothetical protein